MDFFQEFDILQAKLISLKNKIITDEDFREYKKRLCQLSSELKSLRMMVSERIKVIDTMLASIGSKIEKEGLSHEYESMICDLDLERKNLKRLL